MWKRIWKVLIQKTIIYNPAPLHISSDNIVDVVDKFTEDTIIRIFGSFEPAKFVSRQLQSIQEESLEKIMKLEETFTGQVLRIQSESDILTMVASALKGKYMGTEGMSGDAIRVLNQKLEEVNRSLEYYKMFIGDCFGDQE